MSPRVVLLRDRIDRELLGELVDKGFGDMVKFVVDVEREIAALGGEMHVDGKAVLLDDGSNQDDLWGGNYFPARSAQECVEFSSLINVRPMQDNSGLVVQDDERRRRIRAIVSRLIGDGAPQP